MTSYSGYKLLNYISLILLLYFKGDVWFDLNNKLFNSFCARSKVRIEGFFFK
jgi:hypothetical protein